jgi:Dockerin type I domain
VLWGDYNDDGVVNAADLAGVSLFTKLAYNLFADMNGDGTVNAADVQIVRTQIGNSLP